MIMFTTMLISTSLGLFFGIIGLQSIVKAIRERRELKAFVRHWEAEYGFGWYLKEAYIYEANAEKIAREVAAMPATIISGNDE